MSSPLQQMNNSECKIQNASLVLCDNCTAKAGIYIYTSLEKRKRINNSKKLTIMKKYLTYAFAGAIALAGASGFTACSSDSLSDLSGGNTNPTYNAETNSVTTQFVLNVAANTNDNSTRQSATTVQKNANFRGMQDAKLIGLATGKANTFIAPYNGETTQTVWTSGSDMKAKVYDLGTLYGSTMVDNTGDKNRDESSHRIVELTLPVTTDAMLVYGRAIPDETVAQNGKVTMPASYAAPENITFGLASRLEDTEAYTQTCNLAALIFNRIMLSDVGEHAVADAITRNEYTQKANLPALKWRTIGTMTQEQIDALTPLEQKLAIAYKVIRDTYKNGSYVHAGSAAAICNVIDDIYSIAKETSDAKATSDAELNAQRLADVIITRIGYYFDRSATPTTFHNLGDKGTNGSPIQYLINNAGVTEAQFESGGSYAKVTNAYLQGYPHAFNIPDGVAQLTFEDFGEGTPVPAGGFKFKTMDNSSSLIDISSTLNPSKYTYPAELLYFDNSLLRVNDNEVAAADYPNGYSKWDDNNGDTAGDGWTGWTTGPVASTTRSVAVKNNINYGVAMLSTKVDYDGTIGDNFEDNRPAAEGVKLAANDIKKLTLTGVLIGGQYQNVGWNFIRNNEDDDNKNFVIFDNQIANGAIPTPNDAPNYTLVFDNYSDDNGNVRVALEFTNNSDKDIYGLGGMIPKGGVFYLAGVLDLSANTETIAWPTYYAIPPYTDAGGTNTTKKRVFIQDYLTTATFKIGRNSLKSAYTTIPDLRASQISLGLSVDLNWRQGLNFNVDF